MRLISQDGTFDVPYEQVVIQRYRDGIYWLNKNLIGVESGISEDFKIAYYSSEAKAIKVMEMIRKSYTDYIFCKEDVMMRAEMSENEKVTNLMESFLYFKFPKDEEVQE